MSPAAFAQDKLSAVNSAYRDAVFSLRLVIASLITKSDKERSDIKQETDQNQQ